MALKISTTPLAPTAPADWRTRVESTVARAGAALAAADMDALRALHAEVDGWDDEGRRHQAEIGMAELVLGAGSAAPTAWIAAYAAAAERLVAVLERRPAEPLLLNYLGVMLYELMELAGAEAAFKAARRLDPALPHVRANLDAVRARRGATASHRLAPALARRVKAAGARARRLAQLARPAKGLTLSVCMIVKDEEEMLPGCLAPIRDVVDEIVVVDTGSGDRTVEIAESFGARVVHFPWNGSFADARNVSLEHATGDWVLQLDADEHIHGEDAARLRELLGRTWREAFHLVETHFTGGDDSALFCKRHLLQARIDRDADGIDTVMRFLADLRESWQQIAANATAAPAEQPV